MSDDTSLKFALMRSGVSAGNADAIVTINPGLTAAQQAAGAKVFLAPDTTGAALDSTGSPARLLRNVVGSSYQRAYARALPFEAFPTVTYDAVTTTLIASPQAINGAVSNLPNTKKFGFWGVNKSYLASRSLASSVLVGSRATASTLGGPKILTSYYWTSSSGLLDLRVFEDGFDFTLLIDGQFYGRFKPTIQTGTAQAGAASTITLAAGASAVNGQYNQCYAYIVSGTGAGQVRQITSYVGATKVATVSAAWSVNPDNTSVYSVQDSPLPVRIQSGGGSNYLHMTFPVQSPAQPVKRLIQVIGISFQGVQIGQNDAVEPGPPMGMVQWMIVGDSYPEGTASPNLGLDLCNEIGMELGLQPIMLSQGSTGLWTRGTNNRLNFLNRLAPPTEAWEVQVPSNLGYTGGTWSVSITYNGVTQTVSGIAYNMAAAGTLETSLNALVFNGFSASTGVAWVGPTGQGCFCVARGDLNTPFIVIANGMVGATLSVDLSQLTGPGSGYQVVSYVGDLVKNTPVDKNGKALPFLLMIVGSGNDTAATGYSDQLLQNNAVAIANAITKLAPTAAAFFTGIVTNSDGTGGNGIITAADVGHNNALLVGAQALPLFGGLVPFIDTYSEGIGGEAIFTGTGTVGSPTNGNRDAFKSLIASGHPTGLGKQHLAGWLSKRIFDLLLGTLA